MFYLVHCDTNGCVNFQAIVGIANSKQGLMELLFNYHKFLPPHTTFEETYFDIQIFEITEENYNYLLNETTDKLDKITENHKKNNFNPECQNSDFLFTILDNDGPKYDIFEKDFHKKYWNIVKKSKQLII